jgi:hypothetical protein
LVSTSHVPDPHVPELKKESHVPDPQIPELKSVSFVPAIEPNTGFLPKIKSLVISYVAFAHPVAGP